MVEDRTGSSELTLTQKFLATMLGLRRTSVALAAGEMQRMGLIRYQRGKVCIQQREGLEGRACECYRVMKRLLIALYRSGVGSVTQSPGAGSGVLVRRPLGRRWVTGLPRMAASHRRSLSKKM